MRIALYQHEMDRTAEHELSMRIKVAGENVGIEVKSCATSREIYEFAPDLVLAMHFRLSKLTDHPTFGCMWNPHFFFANEPSFVRNILSYDGYLFGGRGIEQFISDTTFTLAKEYVSGTFFPSCQKTEFFSCRFDDAHLAVLGTNWDGNRFEPLFRSLAESGQASFFGPGRSWDHVGPAYAGEVAFDGKSVLPILRQCGVTLALHRTEHLIDAAPNMRLFEGVAAGTAVITEDQGFAREAFGDTLLYVDPTLPPQYLAEQILSHVAHVRSQPQVASERARAAHAIFLERYSLEQQLIGLREIYSQHLKPTPPTLNTRSNENAKIDCIVRAGFREPKFLHRAFEALAAQTVSSRIRVLLVNHFEREDVSQTIEKFRSFFPIEEIRIPHPVGRSHSLWAALRLVESEYFCILDDDDLIHRDHLACLSTILSRAPGAIAAYSGAIRVWEGSSTVLDESVREPRALLYFEPYDQARLIECDNFIPSNSFLARSAALDERSLEDPELDACEDLWLLNDLALKGSFIPSWRVTSEFYWRHEGDNITNSRHLFLEAADRIRTRLQFTNIPAQRLLAKPVRAELRLPSQLASIRVQFAEALVADLPSQGSIDSVQYLDERVEISGWIPVPSRGQPFSITIHGIPKGQLLRCEMIERPDVARARNDWTLYRSGFRLTIALKGEITYPICLTGNVPGSGVFALSQSPRIASLLRGILT